MKAIHLNKRIVYVTGLPRAGSTLMCQLLGHHPLIYSPQHSSPLEIMLMKMRHDMSDNKFFLAQLDTDFELMYQRVINGYRGFINGWFAETELPVVVDKNRGWVSEIETLRLLDPNFKLIVCVRDVRQIFGSVESQHRKTLLIDFAGHMAAKSPAMRADALLDEKTGIVGAPLKSIERLQDLDDSFHEHICYVVFEELMADPVGTMNGLFGWFGLPPHDIDPNNLQTRPTESDSHYNYKFLHKIHKQIRPPHPHNIPPRIDKEIVNKFKWFYEMFYPDQLPAAAETAQAASTMPANGAAAPSN
ncbi:MAG: sulfotransferase [Chloroflexota bacterium]